MIHESASSGYKNNSDNYVKARPSYHPELLKRLKSRISTGKIIDLGAGTGIFTKQLVEAGLNPIAIEPVPEMRNKLADQLPSTEVRDGTAENTGLESNSVDVVIAAQAFHWFNYSSALAEIKRILVSGGLLVCVWNVRDVNVDWVGAYESVLSEYEGSTPRHSSKEWRKAIDLDPSFQLVDEWSIPNPQASSSEAVVDRALSTSFIGALDSDTKQKIAGQIRDIVSDLGNEFDFPYVSEMQIWKITA